MTWPAACVPSWPWAEDQARRGEVQRQPQQGGDQQHGREGGEFQRRLISSAVIRISTDEVIEIASRTSSRKGGSGRISTIDDRHDADARPTSPRASQPSISRPSPDWNPGAAGELMTAVVRLRTLLRPRWRFRLPGRPLDRHAFVGILLQLVAQRADRDAEDVGGMRAVAEAVVERVEDQSLLDLGDGAADQRALMASAVWAARARGPRQRRRRRGWPSGRRRRLADLAARASSTARCMAFSSSRTLPGQRAPSRCVARFFRRSGVRARRWRRRISRRSDRPARRCRPAARAAAAGAGSRR
jgi:hypothetical protein